MKHLKHWETSWNSRHSMRRYRRSMRRRRRSMWRRLRLGQRRRRSREGIRCDNIGSRCGDVVAWCGDVARRGNVGDRAEYRRYQRGVSGDIGDCGVGITPQMCNRVTNHHHKSWRYEYFFQTCAELPAISARSFRRYRRLRSLYNYADV